MNILEEFQNDAQSDIAVANINNLIKAFGQCENIEQVGNALNCLPTQCLQQIEFCIQKIYKLRE